MAFDKTAMIKTVQRLDELEQHADKAARIDAFMCRFWTVAGLMGVGVLGFTINLMTQL